jgi:two-component system sensor histidine kinase BaeS
VGRHWLAPVLQAQEAARRIAQGAFDVRLQRRGPGEFGALIDDINEMAASLQRLEGSRRRWIAELSHELRTPLAVLRAEIEGLVDGVRPLEHAALRSLQGEVERLTRLTDDFHQLALSDLRALPCHFEPVDLAALLQEVVDRHAERARAAGLSLRLAEMPIGVTLRADAQRLQQLFDNLLENSLRYTDAPGRIDISARRERDRVRVSVEDSAPGVPPEALQRLFEPLYRVEASRNRRSGGSGLGLAICRAIVQSHGGRISALASPLGGVRIDCELPL